MIDIQTSAPGKVILAGEYAVLQGAPAICMAVDRRAHVSISASDNDYHSVLAPGFSEAVGCFRVAQTGLEWISGGADFALLAAAWKNVAAIPAGYVNIVLDSNEFIDVDSRRKLGIGSSAALTVALTAALDLVTGGERSMHRVAAAAHRDFQNGVGSGADIACSLTGGIVEYRMDAALNRTLQWPEGLHYALLWSGVAADTGKKLQKLSQFEPGGSAAELVAAANSVAAKWRENRPAAILAELRSYTATLRRFDIDHELGIFGAGHARLADASSSELVYKPCGAGAGDLGIAVASDAAAIAAFIETAKRQNFKHLRMAIEASGLRRDGDQP